MSMQGKGMQRGKEIGRCCAARLQRGWDKGAYLGVVALSLQLQLQVQQQDLGVHL